MALESVSALGYIEIGASDLAAWKQYATAVLGVEVLENQGELLLRYDEEIWRIRVTDSGEDDITCAGFLCESESVLLTVAARLRSLGFDVTGASAEDIARRGVEAMQICHDPAGLRIELYTGSRSAAGRFISPAGVSGFVTGEQGLGHMVLTVPDPDAANRFYMEGLGFLLSDHIYMQTPMGELMLTFLHCNPRHHTLALAPIPVPQRLNHFMLQTVEFDDVGYGLDRAKAHGVRIASSLGKHTNDHMTSFYMVTPSGFDCEYGYGGIEIDDATWETTSYNAPSLWGHARN